MPEALIIWPGNPGLSLLLWALVVVLIMFGARTPAHRAIQGVARAVQQACRLATRALNALQERVAERNREVLLSGGLEDTEKQILEEYERISASVDRDLGSYPTLHRSLAEQVKRMDEDYRRSSYGPPEPEGWSATLKTASDLAKGSTSETAAARAIEALHGGLKEAHDEAVEEYRAASSERHRVLSKMVPAWRRMDHTLSRIERAVENIFERARHIDQLMETYKEIARGSERAERMLASSALTQFFVAGFVLTVASLGGFINFQLIALPMSEMVGATSELAGMRTSDIAALVIIMVEITMGIFLMESLRITRLFPVIGRLDARTRRKMAWATFSILLILASVEASLAYMRDMLASDRAALTRALAGGTVERPEFMWIPSLGQMVMGFILPFALTFVAIPLESFVHSARSVGGNVVVGLLRTGSFSLHLLGLAAKHVGQMLQNVYDVVIFLPLKVEEAVHQARDRQPPRELVESESHAPSA